MTDKNWRNKNTDELFEAFLQMRTVDEMAAFCRDLMTEAEIKEFAGRWQVAQMLSASFPQRQVAAQTGVSIATVTRVNQWLQRGEGGYKKALERIETALLNKHQHSQQAIAGS